MSALSSATHKDGRWYSQTPGQHTATVKVYANWTRKRSYHGRVARFDIETQKWVSDKCPHNHDKQSAARKCGEAAARRLNKATPVADSHGNVLAAEGCDRCSCGAKYWENDRCVSCGAAWTKEARS